MLKKKFNAILNTELFKTVQETADELQLETYVIGGFVRDHLLNRNRNQTDIDIVVIGSGIELAQALQKKLKRLQKFRFLKPTELRCSNGRILLWNLLEHERSLMLPKVATLK